MIMFKIFIINPDMFVIFNKTNISNQNSLIELLIWPSLMQSHLFVTHIDKQSKNK